jgi:N-acetylglucosamine kinase-like BadF-type ATPase
MRHVIGIDAGGTKTVGMLADESGGVLAEARGGGANLQTHGELEVEKVFDHVLESLGRERPVAALCLGIAGVDRPHDEGVIRAILRRLGWRQNARVVNDAAVALAAGAPDGYGVVILAGTGSIAYGMDPAGKSARSGGYGFLLADEGSGYWLGHQALRAVVRATDGRGPHTLLQPLVFGVLEVSSVADMIPRVYEKGLPKHRVAALAPLVQRASDQGDRLAGDLLDTAADELGRAARAVARQIALPETFPLVLAGGVFRGCPSLAGRIEACLALAGAQPHLLEGEPARGAVRLALEALP